MLTGHELVGGAGYPDSNKLSRVGMKPAASSSQLLDVGEQVGGLDAEARREVGRVGGAGGLVPVAPRPHVVPASSTLPTSAACAQRHYYNTLPAHGGSG